LSQPRHRRREVVAEIEYVLPGWIRVHLAVDAFGEPVGYGRVFGDVVVQSYLCVACVRPGGDDDGHQ